MKRYLTNKELINDIANSHPMAEAYILSAIENYSKAVSNSEGWGENGLINFDMWKELAIESINRIEHRSEG